MNSWNIVKRNRDVRAEMKKNGQLLYSTHELDRDCDLGLDVSELGTRLVGEGRTHIDRIVQWRITSESLRPVLGNWATAPQLDPWADGRGGRGRTSSTRLEGRISWVSTRHDAGEDGDELRVTPRRSTRQRTHSAIDALYSQRARSTRCELPRQRKNDITMHDCRLWKQTAKSRSGRDVYV